MIVLGLTLERREGTGTFTQLDAAFCRQPLSSKQCRGTVWREPDGEVQNTPRRRASR